MDCDEEKFPDFYFFAQNICNYSIYVHREKFQPEGKSIYYFFNAHTYFKSFIF